MATVTTLANDIATVVSSDLIQGFFRNDEFFSLFPQKQAGADTADHWHVLTAGLTGTLKAEGTAFSAAQATTNSRAGLGYHRHDSTISFTDDLLAALGPNGSNSYWQGLAAEVLQQRLAIQQAIMTRWLGAVAGTDGLGIAIDSAGTTYAGLVHNAVQGWASTVVAVGGALTYAVLDDMIETLRDDPIRAKTKTDYIILCPENQVTNYTRLSGPGVRNTFVLGQNAPGAQSYDIGPAGDESFSKIPMFGIAEMTNTEMYFLNKNDAIIQYRQQAVGDRGGGWASEEIARGGFTSQVNMSWYGHLKYIDPYRAGKFTGVTA